MKIAYFMEQAISENYAGCEKYFIESVKYLSQMAGVEADLITMGDTFSSKVSKLIGYVHGNLTPDVPVRATRAFLGEKLGNGNYIKCNSVRDLRSKLGEYDVIYSKNEILEAFFLKYFLGYKALPPVIFGVHTPHVYTLTETLYSKIHNFLYGSWFYKFLCSGVSAFHLSNEISLKIFKKEFSSKGIYKILYPFDVAAFQDKAKKYEYKIRSIEEVLNIMWIGRLTEQKGVQDLVNIIDTLSTYDISKSIRWHIFGDGSERDLVKTCADRHSNVTYHGYIDNLYIPSVLSQADLFVSTSKWEVSPFNVIEALSMDVPVFAYSIPGPADLVDQDSGLLLEDSGELIRAIESYMLNKHPAFAHISSRLAAKLAHERIYTKILNMFKEVSEKE